MLKTENKEAATINTVISAKCLPGQIRLPYPNVDEITESSRNLPSLSKNRSGLKASGSGYMAGSCKIALEPVNATHHGQLTQLSHHEFGSTIAPDGVFQIKRRSNCYALTFGYEETVINVVFCSRMGNSCT